MSLKQITNKNFEKRLQAIERKNFEATGGSISWVSIGNHLQKAIKEVWACGTMLIIDEDEFKKLVRPYKFYLD